MADTVSQPLYNELLGHEHELRNENAMSPT